MTKPKIIESKIVNNGNILRVIVQFKGYSQTFEFEAKDMEEMDQCEFCQSSNKRK